MSEGIIRQSNKIQTKGDRENKNRKNRSRQDHARDPIFSVIFFVVISAHVTRDEGGEGVQDDERGDNGSVSE
jgi:hypothetical protein